MPKSEPMKAKSKSQRRLFGWAYSCLKDKEKDCPPNIKKLGKKFKEKYPEDFKGLATSKQKGLPEKVKKVEEVLTFGKFTELLQEENN